MKILFITAGAGGMYCGSCLRELHEIWQESERRKHLAGPFWLGGYYIPPSQQPGPGPPLQIWGRGFGTSLWRDPVTGWPIR